jgi:uncharacterized protein YfaP (DUF2135 family)
MHRDKATRGLAAVALKQILAFNLTLLIISGIFPVMSSSRFFAARQLEFLTSREAWAQREASAESLDPQAKSKYEAGVAALQKGDCAAAIALFKQAIAIDPRDRTDRVGMFMTEYYPNQKLKAAEQKCASTTVSAPVALQITSPTSLTVPNETDRTTVQGAVQGGQGGLRVLVNGRDVAVGGDGRFSTTIALNVGGNDISIRASDATGKGPSKSLTVTRREKEVPSTPPPTPPPSVPPVTTAALELTALTSAGPKQTLSHEMDSVTVKGVVKGGDGSHNLTIDGREVRVEGNGSFSATVPVQIGKNQITVRATDGSGKVKTKQLTVTRLAAPASVAPPALSITSPSKSEQTVSAATDKIAVSGTVTGGSGAVQVTINDRKVSMDKRGAFSTSSPLGAGENRLIVRARDSAGKEDQREFLITRAEAPPMPIFPPPVLSVTEPSEIQQSVPFDTDKITLKGSVSGGEGTARVTVNGREVRTETGGAFTASITLNPGENKLSVKVRDSAGKEDGRELRITRLPRVYPPPVLSMSSPSDLEQSVPFETDKITVKGSVSGGEGTSRLTINGREVRTETGGSFAASVALNPGDNSVSVKVRDSAGKEDGRELRITRLPRVYPPPVLSMSSPSDLEQSVPFETDGIPLKGSVSGGDGEVKLTVNGQEIKTGADGSFSILLPIYEGDNRIIVKVRDSAGKEDGREFRISRREKVYPPPVLSMTSPSEPRQFVAFETDSVIISGSFAGGKGAPQVTVNDKPVKADSAGAFSMSMPLSTGENALIVRVKDSAGREDSKELLISRREQEQRPPVVLSVSSPTAIGDDGRVNMKGTVSGGTGQLKLMVDGKTVPLETGGSFTAGITLKPGRNRISFQAEDSTGKQDRQVWLLFNYSPARK